MRLYESVWSSPHIRPNQLASVKIRTIFQQAPETIIRIYAVD